MSGHATRGEFGLIEWIRERTAARPCPWTMLGIGDDCAILAPTAGRGMLATTDMLMDGRHFVLERDGAEAVGYKALGVNISDIAAMAGVPRVALIAVALPRSKAVAIAQGLHQGARAMADRFNVELVGGDTNAWDGPLVISVTLLGETTERGGVTRSGAQAGDAILVTGALGGSLQSGRHLRPEPRVELALAIHRIAPIHAMIDLSDGLAGDLGHILDESGGKGAILDADQIPIHADVPAAARDDDPLEHALADGEDFELCLTVGPHDLGRILARFPGIRRIGIVTDESARLIRFGDGQIKELTARGFDHLRATP